MDRDRVERLAKNVTSFLATYTSFAEIWATYSEATRLRVIREIADIIGREVKDPFAWDVRLQSICNNEGYLAVANKVVRLWCDSGSTTPRRILGPRADRVEPCNCDTKSRDDCEWCGGAAFVPFHVAELMRRSRAGEADKPNPALDEDRLAAIARLRDIGCRSVEMTLPDETRIKVDFVVETDRDCMSEPDEEPEPLPPRTYAMWCSKCKADVLFREGEVCKQCPSCGEMVSLEGAPW